MSSQAIRYCSALCSRTSGRSVARSRRSLAVLCRRVQLRCKLCNQSNKIAGSLSMTAIRWLCMIMAGLACCSSEAFAARMLSAPASPAAVSRPQDPAAQPPNQIVETRIAAVVNDEVISVGDLQSRLKMVMLSSNFPDSQETRQRIASQVLRTIVDEKLQMQEAKRQNVTATEGEIKKAISQIAKQNNLQPDQLDAALKAHGIDRASLVDQLTASIVWAKLVRRLVSQTNVVSEDEIDDA